MVPTKYNDRQRQFFPLLTSTHKTEEERRWIRERWIRIDLPRCSGKRERQKGSQFKEKTWAEAEFFLSTMGVESDTWVSID